MNVFEDLVSELKEANLLESTVVDGVIDERAGIGNAFNETTVPDPSEGDDDFDPAEILAAYDEAGLKNEDSSLSIHISNAPKVVDPIHETDEPRINAKRSDAPAVRQPATGSEFFKKKAVGEVSSLQMVEHVITGVEREYLKVLPRPFDDFNAKKALNTFINSETAVNSEEHAAAEFALMQETESWCTALALRDREIPVPALRQYCERSRPALSSQALLALGRFYRNLPYSEPIRAKFDFVITRLFSRSVGQEKRVCLFNREEMLGHINTLYSDWSSIPLYDVSDDDNRVMLTALSFEDLAIEAENASAFDQLIESDFFGRLRMFKESISELFYAPQVTAAAIDCNIRIGNTYVDLIDRERKRAGAEALHSRYSDHDSEVSEVTGKTLQLRDLLRELESGGAEPKTDAPEPAAAQEEAAPSRPPKKSAKPGKEEVAKLYTTGMSFTEKLRQNAFGINRWVLVFAIAMLSLSALLYVWSSYTNEESASTVGVKAYNVEQTPYKDYVQAARISSPTMYFQMKQNWDNAPKEKKTEVMQKMVVTATENGCTQVSLTGANGKNAGFAAAGRVDIPIR